MGLTFVPNASGGWFLRTSRGLTELVQIHVTGEVEQPGGEALRVGLCGQSPVLLGDGDPETGHGGGDLAGQVRLRDGLVDRPGGVSGAQRRDDHGIEVERHQRRAEREQGGPGG